MSLAETNAQKPNATRVFNLADRLKHGSFSLKEAMELAGVSSTKFYNDKDRGLIKIHKRGRASFVTGPDLAAYLGQPIDQ